MLLSRRRERNPAAFLECRPPLPSSWARCRYGAPGSMGEVVRLQGASIVRPEGSGNRNQLPEGGKRSGPHGAEYHPRPTTNPLGCTMRRAGITRVRKACARRHTTRSGCARRCGMNGRKLPSGGLPKYSPSIGELQSGSNSDRTFYLSTDPRPSPPLPSPPAFPSRPRLSLPSTTLLSRPPSSRPYLDRLPALEAIADLVDEARRFRTK